MTEIHRTANKELFLLHAIAADRSLHDLGLTPKAKKCESMIKKAMMLMKENYQPEPVQGAREDQAKRAAYDSAKAQRDKMVKIRNKTVGRMFTTLKGYMHETIRYPSHFRGDYSTEDGDDALDRSTRKHGR